MNFVFETTNKELVMYVGSGITFFPLYDYTKYHSCHLFCLSPITLVADDLRLLSVSGCISIRVHTVTPQSAAGTHQAANAAMLRTQVTHTHTHMLEGD